jgi:peptidoglycan/LPS O-acetylase OafA/YrhL
MIHGRKRPAKLNIVEVKIKKLDYVDALRGLAIIGVLLTHITGKEFLPQPLLFLANQSSMGVQLFFFVSAFTLFSSLSFRRGSEKKPWLGFFVRRFFRIAPLYYLAIIYYFWQVSPEQTRWLGNTAGVTVAGVAANFLFLHGLYPYWLNTVVPGGWSVAAETFFYLLLPALFLKIKNGNQALNFFTFSLLLRMISVLVLSPLNPIADWRLWDSYLFFFFPNQLPIFALGIIMFFILQDGYRPKFTMISFWLAAASFSLNLGISVGFLSYHLLYALLFLALGLILSKWSCQIIVNPILCYIGKISFSMYLVHFTVIDWLRKLGFFDQTFMTGNLKYVLSLFAVFTLTIIISSFSYRFVELTMINFGKKIVKKIEQTS